jgi:hypothetical protein
VRQSTGRGESRLSRRSARHSTLLKGVRPGSFVSHVETVFGKTKEIVESEIESRQYIVFESQPAFLRFRLDYTGVFPSGGTTREFKPGARILSIAISSH